jgi:hypothetical protein
VRHGMASTRSGMDRSSDVPRVASHSERTPNA